MIEFDPQIHTTTTDIVLVGCGGTGGEIAKVLARILYHMRDRNIKRPQSILFVDPDVVESKNIGRQNFAPCDIGRNKAQVLAERFSLTLGMDIQYANEHFDADKHMNRNRQAIVLGAVDTHTGRAAIADCYNSHHLRPVWIDAGNHLSTGQVVIGNAWERSTPSEGKLYKIEHVASVYPELLKPEESQPDLSCADLLQQDLQHLLINQQMALISGQYLYKILMREPIYTHKTYVDIATGTMRSDLI